MNHGRSYGIRRVRRRDKISADQWNAVAEAAVIRTNSGNYSGNSTGFHAYTRVGGSGSGRVQFEIDSFDEYTGVATCTPLTKPESADNPGTDENGKIQVIDILGCLFDEPAEELVGRRGTADWLIVLTNVEAGPQWVVDGLCCPPVEPLAE